MKKTRLGMKKVVLGIIVVMGCLGGTTYGELIQNFDANSVDTSVWTDCLDLFDDGNSYDWHAVPSPGDWTARGGCLVKGTGYPSKLTANFAPVTFTSGGVVYVKARIMSLSSRAMEIEIGQAGNKGFTVYLNADLVAWTSPLGTGYLLQPFFAPGPDGEARPTDGWFDVVVEIDKTTDTISLYVDDVLKASTVESSWLAGLPQIDTVTMTVGSVDSGAPWYVDYVHVTDDGAPVQVDPFFIEDFDGTEVDTYVWTECVDLFDPPGVDPYGWYPVASPSDWTVSAGNLVKGTGYPSQLTGHFAPIPFASNPVIYVKTRIMCLSAMNMEFYIGQAGNQTFTTYLNANQPWGTGYLLMPFYAPGPGGEARPTDGWFDVVIEINKTTNTISLSVDGDTKCSTVEAGWLAGLAQIDTVTIVAGSVDSGAPWYVEYVHVTDDPAPVQVDPFFIEDFDGTAVDTDAWTDCRDLFDNGSSYDWHAVPSPSDWSVSDGSLVKGTGYPSKLTAHFAPIPFASNPSIYVKSRIKCLSLMDMEIDTGQAGNKSFTTYLKANLSWIANFPPDGTGYLLYPFFAGGDSGDARPTDDWFDVVIEINKTTNTINLTVDGELKVSTVETGWLAGLIQIDTVTITVSNVDGAAPWYVEYIHVTDDPGPVYLPCGAPGTVYLSADISGPVGERDCHVDIYDIVALASDWMGCTEPNQVNCP